MYDTVDENQAPDLSAQDGSTATLSEDAVVSTRLLHLAAFDKDAGQTLTYTVQGSLSSIFGIEVINSREAWLILAARRLDYERVTSYNVLVRVTDDGIVKVRDADGNLQDSEDTIRFGEATVIVNVEDVLDVPSITSVESFDSDGLVTVGGETIRISGTWFGSALPADPLEPVLDDENAQPNLNVSYGKDDLVFVATECVVSSQDPSGPEGAITCRSNEGYGHSLAFTVCVSGQCSAVSDDVVTYANPSVGRFEGIGAEDASTAGGEEVIIIGRQFGTVEHNAVDAVTYGRLGTEYTANDCEVVQDHTRIRCRTTIGTGTSLRWQVTVGGLGSVTPTTSYGAPEITGISGPGAVDALTEGGEEVTITGVNFGTLDSEITSVRYGPAGRSLVYVATDCHVTVPLSEISCITAPGFGTDLEWTVSISDQASPRNMSTNYAKPHIDSIVSLSGRTGLPTEGNDVLECRGMNFGSAGVAQLTFGGFVASNLVFVSHRVLQFTSRPGDGPGVPIQVSVGDSQASQVSNVVILDFSPPRVVSLQLISGAAGQLTTIRVIGSAFGVNCWKNCYSNPSGSCASACSNQLPAVWIDVDPALVPDWVESRRLTERHECAIQRVESLSGQDGAESYIECTTTQVLGNLTVSIGGQLADVFVYDYESLLATPAVLSITPDKGPTTGVRVRLTGSNLREQGVAVLTNAVSRVEVDPCPEATCYGPSHIDFDIPPGQGEWQVRVRVMSTTIESVNFVKFTYDSPEITDVYPLEGTSEGGFELTLEGINFGLDLRGVVSNITNLPVPESAVYIGASRVPCRIVVIGHTEIRCIMPAGVGKDKVIVFEQHKMCVGACAAGGAVASVTASQLFRYTPPLPLTMEPSHSPTSGGIAAYVTGHNFGTNIQDLRLLIEISRPNSANVGGSSIEQHEILQITFANDTFVSFVVPQGSGASVDLIVEVGGQGGRLVDAFGYDPPVVSAILPEAHLHRAQECTGATGNVCVNFEYPAHSQSMRILGRNFGTTAELANSEEISVLFGGEECLPGPGEDSVWVSDTRLDCLIVDHTVGPKDVIVTIAYQQASRPHADGLRAICDDGYFGQLGDRCEVCPDTGASCEGGETLPVAIQGFWSVTANATVMRECSPEEACAGNNQCNIGYEGWMCSSCERGKYSRSLITGLCEPCPPNPLLVLIGYATGTIAVGVLLYILYQKGPSVAALAIGIDYFQVIAIFSSLKLKWPESTVQAMKVASVTMANVDIASPECSFQITYIEKFYMIEGMPLLLIFTMVVMFLFKLLLSKVMACCCRKGRRSVESQQKLQDAFYKGAGLFIASLQFQYVFLCAKALEGLQCEDRGAGESLLVDPTILCTTDAYQRMAGFAVLAIVGYGLGIPLLYGIILFKFRYQVMVDQALRIRGLGEDRDTNPFYDTALWFKRLYHKYQPRHFYYSIIILVQKWFVVFVPMAFRTQPVFAATATAFVLFIAFAFQMAYQPFRQNASVEADFSQDMEAINEADLDQKARAEAVNMLLREKATTSVETHYIHDYNRLQSTFLACAIFVLLSGVLFASSDFEDDLGRTIMEVLVLFIVGTSTLVCSLAIVAEFWASVQYFFAALKHRRKRNRVEVAPEGVEANAKEEEKTWVITAAIRGVRDLVGVKDGQPLRVEASIGLNSCETGAIVAKEPTQTQLSRQVLPVLLSHSPTTDTLHVVIWHRSVLVGTLSVAVDDIAAMEDDGVLQWVPLMSPMLVQAAGEVYLDVCGKEINLHERDFISAAASTCNPFRRREKEKENKKTLRAMSALALAKGAFNETREGLGDGKDKGGEAIRTASPTHAAQNGQPKEGGASPAKKWLLNASRIFSSDDGSAKPLDEFAQRRLSRFMKVQNEEKMGSRSIADDTSVSSYDANASDLDPTDEGAARRRRRSLTLMRRFGTQIRLLGDGSSRRLDGSSSRRLDGVSRAGSRRRLSGRVRGPEDRRGSATSSASRASYNPAMVNIVDRARRSSRASRASRASSIGSGSVHQLDAASEGSGSVAIPGSGMRVSAPRRGASQRDTLEAMLAAMPAALGVPQGDGGAAEHKSARMSGSASSIVTDSSDDDDSRNAGKPDVLSDRAALLITSIMEKGSATHAIPEDSAESDSTSSSDESEIAGDHDVLSGRAATLITSIVEEGGGGDDDSVASETEDTGSEASLSSRSGIDAGAEHTLTMAMAGALEESPRASPDSPRRKLATSTAASDLIAAIQNEGGEDTSDDDGSEDSFAPGGGVVAFSAAKESPAKRVLTPLDAKRGNQGPPLRHGVKPKTRGGMRGGVATKDAERTNGGAGAAGKPTR